MCPSAKNKKTFGRRSKTLDCLSEKCYNHIVSKDKHRRKQVLLDNGKPLAEVEGKYFWKVVRPYADCGVRNFFMSGDVLVGRLKEVIHVGKC
jgi:hypothetical protein